MNCHVCCDQIFGEWNKGELKSFLIEITADIFKVKDTREDYKENYLVDSVLDQTGSKGTGKWTCQEAAERGIGCPTINAALNARYMSALKQERVDASKVLDGPKIQQVEDKKAFIQNVKKAVCSLCSAIEDNESVLLSKLSFSAALKEFAL